MKKGVIMKAAFYTLGCKVNSYETEVNIEMFKNNGYEIVPFNEKADVYVINTCSVTNTADSKSRKIIREAVKRGDNPIVVVMGCYSQIKYLEASKIPGVSIVIGTNNKSKILDLIEEYWRSEIGNSPTAFATTGLARYSASPRRNSPKESPAFRQRVSISIAEKTWLASQKRPTAPPVAASRRVLKASDRNL